MHEKPLARVRELVAEHGEEKLKIFDAWVRMFGEL